MVPCFPASVSVSSCEGVGVVGGSSLGVSVREIGGASLLRDAGDSGGGMTASSGVSLLVVVVERWDAPGDMPGS